MVRCLTSSDRSIRDGSSGKGGANNHPRAVLLPYIPRVLYSVILIAAAASELRHDGRAASRGGVVYAPRPAGDSRRQRHRARPGRAAVDIPRRAPRVHRRGGCVVVYTCLTDVRPCCEEPHVLPPVSVLVPFLPPRRRAADKLLEELRTSVAAAMEQEAELRAAGSQVRHARTLSGTTRSPKGVSTACASAHSPCPRRPLPAPSTTSTSATPRRSRSCRRRCSGTTLRRRSGRPRRRGGERPRSWPPQQGLAQARAPPP
jgi:hypothetical protein